MSCHNSVRRSENADARGHAVQSPMGLNPQDERWGIRGIWL
nr:MAG TPA: hypothetical protein [Caudoviricetes sp.]